MDKKSRDLVMGKLYLKNKDYKMAEKSFSEYLSTNPEDFQALKMLAQVQEHLNDTAKAFDLYQRCYLAQPDRKGVLLDICRLLLVNDSHLDHVDKKKWLKLAIQSFPTNPIVANLRDSLPDGQDSNPGRVTTEDMILEKLTKLEDRFENFEDRFKNFEDRLKSIDDKLSDLKSMPKSVSVDPPKSVSVDPPKPVSVAPPKTVSVAQLKSVSVDPLKSVSVDPPKSVSVAPLKSAFADPPKSLFADPPKSLFADPPKSLFADPPKSLFADPPKPVSLDLPKLDFGQLSLSTADAKPFGSSIKINPQSGEEGTNNPFNFSGVNLFAESLKKFNMPTEGVWGAPKKDEDDGNDDDNEVVQTEELPIENTCDMKPIEIKSGEEDEDIVFQHRCKLFRFRDREYKERGLGNIKVLKHKDTGKGRLIMRRELINLVCLNCWSCTNVGRVRDTQVRFAGLDASDGEPEMTVFLAKFKTKELTDEFERHLTDLFSED